MYIVFAKHLIGLEGAWFKQLHNLKMHITTSIKIMSFSFIFVSNTFKCQKILIVAYLVTFLSTLLYKIHKDG